MVYDIYVITSTESSGTSESCIMLELIGLGEGTFLKVCGGFPNRAKTIKMMTIATTTHHPPHFES